jgi:5-carboxymethyl-2-hydroxymuconate isomerase
MVKENKYLKMEIFIKVNIKMEDLMDLVPINGKIKNKQYMKVILKMDSGMEKENGHKTRQNILEAISKDLNKDMDNFTLVVEIFIKEILFKINEKVMDKCFGQMEVFIKENGGTESKMERVKSI